MATGTYGSMALGAHSQHLTMKDCTLGSQTGDFAGVVVSKTTTNWSQSTCATDQAN